MKWFCFLIILLLVSVAYAVDPAGLSGGANPDEERNCKAALLTLDFADAYSCYKEVGDHRVVQAQNKFVLGEYAEARSLGRDAIRLKSGFGLCFSYHMCGAAAHAAAIVAVAAEKSGDDSARDAYITKIFNYAKGSGQCEGLDEKATNLCALMYTMSELEGLRKGGGVVREEGSCKLIQGTGKPSNLDILYMGSGFANLTQFHESVVASSSVLLGTAPFSVQKSRINVWELSERTSFDCVTAEPRLFKCNDANQIAESRKKCLNDHVVIVVKSNEWRGAGGEFTTISSWTGMDKTVVIHELGHSFGKLHDEYVYGAGDGFTPQNLGMDASPNCDPSSACPKFTALGGNVCLQKCSFNNYYRSIDNGLMSTLGQPFGAVDEKILTLKLAEYGK